MFANSCSSETIFVSEVVVGIVTESDDRVPLSSVGTDTIDDLCKVPDGANTVSSAGVCLCGLGTECCDSSEVNGGTPKF